MGDTSHRLPSLAAPAACSFFAAYASSAAPSSFDEIPASSPKVSQKSPTPKKRIPLLYAKILTEHAAQPHPLFSEMKKDKQLRHRSIRTPLRPVLSFLFHCVKFYISKKRMKK